MSPVIAIIDLSGLCPPRTGEKNPLRCKCR